MEECRYVENTEYGDYCCLAHEACDTNRCALYKEKKWNKSIIKISETYGYEAQSRQLIEEMAELTQAINKLWRAKQKEKLSLCHDELNCMYEEMADVEIMIEQVKYLLNCEDEVQAFKECKIKRQLERIEKNE